MFFAIIKTFYYFLLELITVHYLKYLFYCHCLKEYWCPCGFARVSLSWAGNTVCLSHRCTGWSRTGRQAAELLELTHTDQVLNLQKEAFLLNFSNLALFFKKYVNIFLKTNKNTNKHSFLLCTTHFQEKYMEQRKYMRPQSLFFILLLKNKILI